jgi:hypothetical protein
VNEVTPDSLNAADLLVVGGPTHMHGLASSMSRKMAVRAVEASEGPLADGELERARDWGASLATGRH